MTADTLAAAWSSGFVVLTAVLAVVAAWAAAWCRQ